MKIKTSGLTGPALDWAVAKAHGIHVEVKGIYRYLGRVNQELVGFWCYAEERNEFGAVEFTPSTDWSQGGPIIEREQLSVFGGNQVSDATRRPYPFRFESFVARMPRQQAHDDHEAGHGPTHLIAAMRCYVASRLGDEVDVPEELLDKM